MGGRLAPCFFILLLNSISSPPSICWFLATVTVTNGEFSNSNSVAVAVCTNAVVSRNYPLWKQIPSSLSSLPSNSNCTSNSAALERSYWEFPLEVFSRTIKLSRREIGGTGGRKGLLLGSERVNDVRHGTLWWENGYRATAFYWLGMFTCVWVCTKSLCVPYFLSTLFREAEFKVQFESFPLEVAGIRIMA